jgi:hypothetical protein
MVPPLLIRSSMTRTAALDVADQQVAADDTGAAPLFHERALDRPGEHRFQRLAEELRPLHPARVRRGDDDGGIRDEGSGPLGEQTPGIQVNGPAAEGILERNDVVNLERHHAVHAHGFDQLCQVARGDRIARLRLPILAGIGKIGDDGGDPGLRSPSWQRGRTADDTACRSATVLDRRAGSEPRTRHGRGTLTSGRALCSPSSNSRSS